ncbi:MAG: hypothetical protein RR319_07100 [Bacteroides sp.]
MRVDSINNEWNNRKHKKVNLAFIGFRLGDNIVNCCIESKKNPLISDLNYSKDSSIVWFSTKICEADARCSVYSFDNKIAKIEIKSDDYKIQKIEDALIDKYGRNDNRDDLLKRTDGKEIIEWKFLNQSICVVKELTEKIVDVKVKKGMESLNLRNPNNKYDIKKERFFDSSIITYSDYKLIDSLDKFRECAEKKMLEEYRLREKKTKDSLINVYRKKGDKGRNKLNGIL